MPMDRENNHTHRRQGTRTRTRTFAGLLQLTTLRKRTQGWTGPQGAESTENTRARDEAPEKN